jgi:hypothetical protein
MRTRRAGIALVAGTALAVSAPAAAWTPAQNKAFATRLAKEIEPSFRTQAPALVLGAVTCVLPAEGTVVRCKAHFADRPAGADVLYLIKATLQETGDIKWTTTGHSCIDAKTGKKLAC